MGATNVRSGLLSPARLSRAIWTPYREAEDVSVTERNDRVPRYCGSDRDQAVLELTANGFSEMRAPS